MVSVVSALRPRTYAVDDRVAIRNRRDLPWLRGTVTGHRGAVVLIRMDDPGVVAVRHPEDVRLVPADEVPFVERHWLPQTVRDQLARKEAARRLRAFAHALLPLDGVGWARLSELADDLDNVLLGDGGGGPQLAAAARALLAPAPADEPAPTPEAEPCPCCLGNPREVCDACGDHDCWAGRLMCDMASGAGTRIAPTP